MRPGTKLPSGIKSFKNKPEVEPPGLLKAISILSIVSIVGVLVFAVKLGLSDLSSPTNYAEEAAYVAVLHFILPFGVAYTVTTNSRFSRHLIALYCLILCTATIAGKGFLGGLTSDFTTRTILSVSGFLIVVSWLFASPKMRYYYLLVSDQPVPPELASRATELANRNRLSPRARAIVEWDNGSYGGSGSDRIHNPGFLLLCQYLTMSITNSLRC